MEKIENLTSYFLAALFMLLMVISIVFFFATHLKRNFNHFKEKQLLQHQFAQTLLQTQLEIQEQTFKKHLAGNP